MNSAERCPRYRGAMLIPPRLFFLFLPICLPSRIAVEPLKFEHRSPEGQMRNALRIRGEFGELHVELRSPRAEADILFQPFQPATMSDISLGAEQKFASVGSVAEALAQTLSDPVVCSIDLIGEAARVEFQRTPADGPPCPGKNAPLISFSFYPHCRTPAPLRGK